MAMTEHLWSVCAQPKNSELIGDKIFSLSFSEANNPARASITDLSSGTSLRYSIATELTPNESKTGSDGEKLWFMGKEWPYFYLYTLTSSGILTKHIATDPSTNGGLLYLNGNIISYNKIYNISGNSLTTMAYTGSPGGFGNDLWVYYNYKLQKINLTNGSNIGDFIPTNINMTSVRGEYFNGKVFWIGPSGILSVNVSTGNIEEKIYTPFGIPNVNTYPNKFSIASDGYIYKLSESNNMVVINPETAQWKVVTLTPSRDYRYDVLPYNNKLWIPSGKPDTWD